MAYSLFVIRIKTLLRFKDAGSVVASILIFSLLIVSLAASEPTYNNAILQASDEAKIARHKLLLLPVKPLETSVSPRAELAIYKMKQALEKLVAAYLSNISTNSIPDVKGIEQDLNYLIDSRRLPAETTISGQDGNDHFGYETWFEAQISSDNRQLLQIKAAFSIACGMDSLLLIFQPDKNGWNEIMNWQSPSYQSIGGAFNTLQYTISMPDFSGKWYVLGVSTGAVEFLNYGEYDEETTRYFLVKQANDRLFTMSKIELSSK